jgi:hypothetical protein
LSNFYKYVQLNFRLVNKVYIFIFQKVFYLRLCHIHIGCSFKFILKVGVEASIVNAPLVSNRVKTQSTVAGEKTGDGISYASHVKNPNPLKARATTFYDPVHNALDKEAQCAWKEGEGSYWPSVYIQKPFMTL